MDHSTNDLPIAAPTAGHSATAAPASSKPLYWRSLAEHEQSPELQEFLHREFPHAVDPEFSAASRRRFMQLLGGSLALAGVGTMGCRHEKDQILPYTRRPEGLIPGVPRFFATTMEWAGNAIGLYVHSYDNRPTKIEGNPNHPESLGSTNVWAQASILDLYDPDRSRSVVRNRRNLGASNQTWSDFNQFVQPILDRLEKPTTAGTIAGTTLAFLVEPTTSKTFAFAKQQIRDRFPNARWVEYTPVSDFQIHQGAKLAFGKPYRPVYNLAAAEVVFALDSDLFGIHASSVRHARDYHKRRQLKTPGSYTRLYVAESRVTITGGMAEHRLPLRAEQLGALLLTVEAELRKLPEIQEQLAKPEFQAFQTEVEEPAGDLIEAEAFHQYAMALAKDLAANRGQSIVAVGPNQPAEVHAVAFRVNGLLGNLGNTIQLYPVSAESATNPTEAIKGLAGAMEAGAVNTLFILGGNPVFDAPADVEFAKALQQVENSIHLGLHFDETSRLCNWHLPQAHYLETWGDAVSATGVLSLQQPLLYPLYDSKSPAEVLLFLLQGGTALMGEGLLRKALAEVLKDQISQEIEWKKCLHDGMAPKPILQPETPTFTGQPTLAYSRGQLATKLDKDNLEVTFGPDYSVYDGRFSNNGWLQELPDPISKLTWDNCVYINPNTAATLGVKHGEVIRVKAANRTMDLAAFVLPGQPENSLHIPLGYGRVAVGAIGGLELATGENFRIADRDAETVGFNTYQLRTTAGDIVTKASVKPLGYFYPLATTQNHHLVVEEFAEKEVAQRAHNFIREGTLVSYLEYLKKHANDHEADKERGHHGGTYADSLVHQHSLPTLQLWDPPTEYESGHQWAMTIDLNACTGCNACVIACQAENNIPIVGKKQVLMNREMHWIRIDRYYLGEPGNPKMVHQPMLCMHCENAPCEQVCPVVATVHTHEGINAMVYNRCIGTRYCSNNCPYKVRRFNYFDYFRHLEQDGVAVQKQVFNPEVTVRSRGVMEKCTFCIQRIQNAKIVAKNERRLVRDGEVTPACAQACPSSAFTFGNFIDKEHRVYESFRDTRAYGMLTELNTRPRVQYLARVSNPNPALATEGAHADGEHHGE